jgi:LysR family glycine cleavage system transcriptional activator
VSQQIASLEVQLGTSLMVKTGRRVVLTEAGERYFEMISDNIDRIADATQNVRGYLSSKSLVVRATRACRPSGSCRASAGFSMRIPISTCASMRPTSRPIFRAEGVDLEIRHGEGNWPGFSSKCSQRSTS